MPAVVRGALLGLVTVLAGCGDVFDLVPLYVPDHYGKIINDPDADEDGDGEPNATDLCPLVPSTEIGGNLDSDGDGVGDLCDPDPKEAGNCLALFDSFAGPSLSPHWHSEGQMATKADGYLDVPGGTESIVYLDTALDLDTLSIEGYVPIGANAGAGRHAIELFFDATRTPLVGGRACAGESDTVTSQATVVDVARGTDTTVAAQPIGTLLVGAGTNLQTHWDPAGCHVTLDNDTVTEEATVPGAPPPGGTVMVRVVNAGFNLRVIAGYGRGCL